MMIYYLIPFLTIIQAINSNPISVCDVGVSFRDSKSCSKYYKCVKNDKYFELEENYCPDSQFFEPSLNECKPIDKLITKCSNLEISNHLSNVESKTRDLEIGDNRYHSDMSKKNDLEISNHVPGDKKNILYIANNSEEDKFLRRTNMNKKSSKSASKSRKNRINKKRKKNWVAIFIKGCSSGIPYDDDDEEQDEQFEEENNEENNLENNDSNNDNNNKLNDEKNDNNLKNPTDLNNDNRQKPQSSKNCNCDEKENQSTNKPDFKENLNNNQTSTQSTNPQINSSTSNPLNNSSSFTSNNEKLLSTTTTTIKPTNSPIRNTSNTHRLLSITTSSATQNLTTTTKSTTPKPTTPKPTTRKPLSSKIIFRPIVMKNPNNISNSTERMDEKEALRRFIEQLRKARPTISKEKETELSELFKEKIEKNKEILNKSNSNVTNFSLNRSHDATVETEIKNLKLNKIENELDIVDLESELNYFVNLADNQTNSTVNRS